MASGNTEPSRPLRKRTTWRGGWLGAVMVAAASVTGCGPVTRLYLEQPRQSGGIPPQEVPYLRLSSSLAQSEAELERRGFAFTPPAIPGDSRPQMKHRFSNAAPGVYESATIRVYFRQAWHRGMFYLLCRDDEVLLVSWHISNMSP